MRYLTLFLALTLITGCIATRPYPLCFCNQTPTSAEYQKIEADIRGVLMKYARTDSNIRFTTDHRWVFVRTTKHIARQVDRIWPRVACIGKKNDDAQMEISKRCMAYISRMLKARTYMDTEDIRQGYLYCGGDPFPTH